MHFGKTSWWLECNGQYSTLKLWIQAFIRTSIWHRPPTKTLVQTRCTSSWQRYYLMVIASFSRTTNPVTLHILFENYFRKTMKNSEWCPATKLPGCQSDWACERCAGATSPILHGSTSQLTGLPVSAANILEPDKTGHLQISRRQARAVFTAYRGSAAHETNGHNFLAHSDISWLHIENGRQCELIKLLPSQKHYTLW